MEEEVEEDIIVLVGRGERRDGRRERQADSEQRGERVRVFVGRGK